LLHNDPSQQGCPGPPHSEHLFVLLHASPGATQKLPLEDMPPVVPWQHVCASAPQPEQMPLLHVPSCVLPQLPPNITHWPSTQQRLLLQESTGQQG
jgi:hypothetical protein